MVGVLGITMDVEIQWMSNDVMSIMVLRWDPLMLLM